MSMPPASPDHGGGRDSGGVGVTEEPLLALRSVHVGHGKVSVLSDIDLDVPRGSFVGLVGPNGVGKTTLLMTIAGLLRPLGGSLQFEGTDITAWSPHRRRRQGVALAPEGRRVFPSLSVEETLVLAHRAASGRRADEHDALDRVYAMFPRLRERRQLSAGVLSGGEQQMLVLARALVVPPKVLLVDEPFLGLAMAVCDDLRARLHALADGTTTVVVADESRKSLQDMAVPRIVELGARHHGGGEVPA